jgi:glucose-1-phosphate thymidylyltransferase
MEAVILCGGLGTRLHPLTKIVPKSLIPFNGKAFLEYIVEEILDLVDGITIVYRGDVSIYKEVMDKYHSDIPLNFIGQRDGDYGTFIPIKMCSEKVQDDLLIIHGDTLVKRQEIANLLNSLIISNNSISISAIKKDSPPPSARVIINKGRGIRLEEHNPTTFSLYYNCGIYGVRKGAIESCVVQQSETTGEYEFTDIVNYYFERDDCYVKEFTEPYIHINEAGDIVRAIRKIQEFAPLTNLKHREGGGYVEHGSLVETGATIRNSYIFNTKVLKGQVIENSCVVNGVVIHEEQ